ncbi:hypothetical protein LSTR_LSTR007741 [Laodelphax striatellus]|uniref:Sugar phosphate transporter domain-containing protein n=1 Tax=Laodelphax striatellus TaxID=195883 RepID=A0A482WJQ8_LAOST|nr:hypothetical protein LSTR_LSTR007741 [Laodelphax striatellus]
MDSFGGFTDEDIQRLSNNPENANRKERDKLPVSKNMQRHKNRLTQKNFTRERILKKHQYLNQNSPSTDIPEEARLSIHQIPESCEEEESIAKENSDIKTKEKNVEAPVEPSNNAQSKPTRISVETKTEKQVAASKTDQHGSTGSSSEKVIPFLLCADANEKALEEFESRQRMMEEQNKQRKEILKKAIADRARRTHEETKRLNEIEGELKKLDLLLSNDVAILRNQIESASLEFSEAHLTFYHKWCMQAVKLPFFVVLSHFSLKWILVTAIRLVYACVSRRPLKEVSCMDQVTRMLPLGVFSALDIAFGSWGLLIIPVSLYTMTKSSTIIFILGFALIFKLEKKSWSLVVIVAMIAIGLFMFTYKATQFDLFGFVMVLFASFSSGLRWTSAQFIMQRSELRLKNPLDVMYYTQPWMFLTVLPFFYCIEGGKISQSLSMYGWDKWLPVFGGGFIALAMELAEYLVLLSTSSLTLSVIGIFKEVTTVILAVKWTGDTMSSLNFAGLLLCLGGILCHVLHKSRTAATAASTAMADEAAAKFLPEGSTSSEDDDDGGGREDSSTEVLFSVLNSRER